MAIVVSVARGVLANAGGWLRRRPSALLSCVAGSAKTRVWAAAGRAGGSASAGIPRRGIASAAAANAVDADDSTAKQQRQHQHRRAQLYYGRPSLNLNELENMDAEVLRASLRKRNVQLDLARLLELNRQRRRLVIQRNGMRKERNELTEAIASLRAGGSGAGSNISSNNSRGKGKEKVESESRAAKTDTEEHSARHEEQQHQHQHQHRNQNQNQYQQQSREQLQARGKELKEAIALVEEQLAAVELSLAEEAAQLPNASHPDAPVGPEANARLVALVGQKHEFPPGYTPRDHVDLATALDIVSFGMAAKTSGAGFYFLKGAGALLELALVQHAVSICIQEGCTPLVVPDLVRREVIESCGYRPRPKLPSSATETADGDVVPPPPSTASSSTSASQSSSSSNASPSSSPLSLSSSFSSSSSSEEDDEEARIEDDNYWIDRTDLGLAATAEIPIAGYVGATLHEPASLPQKYVAVGKAFRMEIGSKGKESRGLYRVHEFTKVEMFAVTAGLTEVSDMMLEDIVRVQRRIYESLGLHFRILDMPTEELGASAYRKFDIEAWLPGRGVFGEISSASSCTDYQARRLQIRYRPRGGGQPTFAHTLNGTAAAIPRLIIAILETYQQPDGSVVIPEVLRKYMPNGMDRIVASK